MSEHSEVAKEGIAYFRTGGGIALFIIGLISLGVTVSAPVVIPVVAVSAILYGLFGIWRAKRQQKQKQQTTEHEAQEHQVAEQLQQSMVVILQEMNASLREMNHPVQISFKEAATEDEEIDADKIINESASLYLRTPHLFAKAGEAVNDTMPELGIRFQIK